MQKLLTATGKSATTIETLSYTDILNLLERLLHSDNKEAADEVFTGFGRFEQDIMTLLPTADLKSSAEDCRTIAKLEHHFFTHNQHEFDGFLEKLKLVQHLPCTLVHGRYDMACQVQNAWDLAQVWPEAELHIIEGAGHSFDEPGILDQLIRTNQRFATRR